MIERWLRRLARSQARRPGAILLLLLAVSGVAAVFAARLRVEGGFEHLLPDGRASVAEYRRVAAKTAGNSTLYIVLETPADQAANPAALRAASDALVSELRALGAPHVGSADNGVVDAMAFVEPRAALYLDAADLEALHREVTERWQYEVAKEGDLLLEETSPPPPLDEARLRRLLSLDDRAFPTFPDGYFQSEDGRAIAVVVRSRVASSDAVQGGETLTQIRGAIERVDLPHYDARMSYGLAGDLYSGVVEVSALNDDLSDVGLLGAALIALVVLLFYLRFRTLVVMLATVAIGILWTAGVARFAVGTLSIGTSFVFTIIAGNGLNSSVIYMARYLEVRKAGVVASEALFVAHKETFAATLTAALASSAAFGSLMTTSFRGFRDLGRLGAIGFALCWAVTLLALPAMLALAERYHPMKLEPQSGWRARMRSTLEAGFGKPFARVVSRAPLLISVGGIAVAVGGLAALGPHLAHDPLEYDLARLRNDLGAREEMMRYRELADRLTHDVGADGMAILVDRVDQVGPLREALNRVRDEAADDEKPFDAVYALDDFVPEQQAHKLPLIREVAALLRKMRARNAISDDTWGDLERFLPADDLVAFTAADLPMGIARPFTESDGTRGRIVYIKPIDSWIAQTATVGGFEDAHYLLRWAASYRETTLPDRSKVLGSGTAVIYADMTEGVFEAIPQATLAAVLAVVLVIALAFGRRRTTLYVLGALLVGVGWMAALIVCLDIKLNYLNFIALPITFGVGVDYAVNIVHRYRRDGRGSVLGVVRETGGAVVLCSATTILGYVALTGSINGAVRSLGLLAVLGELCTLLSAMLVLPAFLLWMDRHATRGAAVGDATASDGQPA